MEITLKKDSNLKRLSELTKKSPEDLADHILTKMVKEELLLGVKEDAGRTIQYFFEVNDDTHSPEVRALYLLDKSTKEISKVLMDVKVWGKANQCPKCGCELYTNGEYLTDWDDGHQEPIWEEEYCSNPECDYSVHRYD